jgi:hypothetical protein
MSDQPYEEIERMPTELFNIGVGIEWTCHVCGNIDVYAKNTIVYLIQTTEKWHIMKFIKPIVCRKCGSKTILTRLAVNHEDYLAEQGKKHD